VPFLEDQIDSIDEQNEYDQKNYTLLNALIKAPDDIQQSVMNGFVTALRFSGQDHVANIFHKESNKVIMSDEHYELLSRKRVYLCKFMNPRDELMYCLIDRKIFSETDKRKVSSKPGFDEMADETIEILLRKPDDAFEQFVDLLRETGQSHVAYILTKKGKSRPLKDEHRRRLLSSPREYLVKKIDSKHSGLIRSLMNKGVFSSCEEQRVTSVQPDTTEDRNEMILNLIARKSQSDFFKFIEALKDTDQTHVIVNLIGEKIVAKIKTVYESRIPASRIHNVDLELLKYMKEMFQRNSDVVEKVNTILLHRGITVSDVRQGCIEITFTCENVQALHDFQQLHVSRELENVLCEAFCPHFAEKGLMSLNVEISESQFVCYIPMTSEHQEALVSSEKSLVHKMTVTHKLLDKLSLCERRRESIESAATPEQQVKTLIDIVSRQSDSAFTQLINALNDTQQTEAADIISKNIKNKTKSKTSELQKTHVCMPKVV